jgi:hypothetical protein
MFGTDPQIIALVQLEEGPRMLSNIVGVDPDPANLQLGMSLEVRFEERDDMVLPMFAIHGEAR